MIITEVRVASSSSIHVSSLGTFLIGMLCPFNESHTSVLINFYQIWGFHFPHSQIEHQPFQIALKKILMNEITCRVSLAILREKMSLSQSLTRDLRKFSVFPKVTLLNGRKLPTKTFHLTVMKDLDIFLPSTIQAIQVIV